MKKTDLLIGFFIGLVSTFIGSYLFLKIKTNYDLIDDFNLLRIEGILGKVFVLGAILNIVVFYILLKKNKEMMARGVILATIILALSTLFL
ncbi:hypothetical protein [Flavobacterium aquatile]|jgi:hypothetical protein|uniref:Uncharacterized protein n=1 Tax=Flavobacterium aquatile LMG 4008 = ATCC 11947 TaxID=1453498 RepID=A0A095TZU7_9FLAO|nr:hypothetical protein [Flavobacterium aquatile]KGD67928.1 hypothetical protein LG45_06370 [Flavobacterium aquatile LMG 4008 = ATCC 11947]OXA65397.1 hypothetical protein B0A61_15635 [Flavobacterium aquatile LMG 4008 = ATCC 11947]GEC78957.1 hypothetical protein FAQ01_18270 [Flavobacterium aquatile]